MDPIRRAVVLTRPAVDVKGKQPRVEAEPEEELPQVDEDSVNALSDEVVKTLAAE